MPEPIFNYLDLTRMQERPFFYTFEPPEGQPWRNSRGDKRALPVHDAREVDPEPSLDREGFALVRHRSAAGDLFDPEVVRSAYYPEMEKLVAESTGASRVIAFDHNVRSAARAESGEEGLQHPVRFVHNDYTEGSGPQRVRDLMGEEAEALLRGRFAVINVWRPLRGPVLATPLAFLDAQSIRREDFVPTDLRYRDRVGEIYSLTYDAGHRWYYYPLMQADEALLLKCYDSASGLARFTAHSAFDDPATPPGAPPRESVEVRTLAFF